MSQAQIDEVLETQATQREDKKVTKIIKSTFTTLLQCKKVEEGRLENEWDRRRLAEAKAALVIEAQMKTTKEQMLKDLAEQNKLLAAEQRARYMYNTSSSYYDSNRQEVMNKDLYVNSLSGAYFDQFGTSSR